MSIEQLHAASRQFPKSFIDTKQGASYVEHSVIVQRMLEVFGQYDMVNIDLIRGHVPAWEGKNPKPPLEDAVTGVLLTVRVHTDEGPRVITEVGEVEFPHNHSTDASRAKHATSDAIKRCAMRMGIGLHLWAQGHYYLDRKMDSIMADAPDTDEVPDAPRPDDKPSDPDAPDEDTPAEAEAVAEPSVPVATPSDVHTERMDVLTDLLRHFPSEFVETLDQDALYGYADESDDNLKRAIDTIERRHQQWEAEHDDDEDLSVPAPGFYFAKGGGFYIVYDKDGEEQGTVRGQDKVPDGYAELDQPIEQVEVIDEGNDQPAKAPGDGSRSFAEELASYPDAFVTWLREQGVNLDSMERHAERSEDMRVNALKIVSNRWREYQQETAA